VSWQPVWTGAGYPDRASRNRLVVSPAFSQDATVLRTVTEGLLVGRPSGCGVHISRDGGTTWSDVDPRWVDMYWSCGSPLLVGKSGSVVAAVADGGMGGSGWNVWAETGKGPQWLLRPQDVLTPPVAAADGTVFVGTMSGIFARGLSAQPTNGPLTCPAKPVLGFGRVFAAQQVLQDRLGCALAAERPVRIHQSLDQGRPAYLVEDVPSAWYSLNEGTLRGYQAYDDLFAHPFPASQEKVYPGIAQQFQSGLMLYTTAGDGTHAILALDRDSRNWWSFPD
jgi:hypothetical protein